MNLVLKDFQQRAVDFLKEHTTTVGTEKQIIIHSPTGSGKTIILISYINEFLKLSNNKTTFIWVSPGKGDLEQQSKKKMEKFYSNIPAKDIDDAILNGFQGGSTYFINWEKITKKGNKAIADGEQKNLFERIADAHRNNINFIIIIDEEHQNNTEKAQIILDALSPKYEIRVSATPSASKTAKLYEIKEVEVINEGLITKALYINEDLDNSTILSSDPKSEADYLIDLAVAKRNEIHQAYEELGKDINPLVLIQFPNMNDELIQSVEDTLKDLGYTHENGLVASWFSPQNSKEAKLSNKFAKINIGTEGCEDSITNLNAKPQFLLFKQALSTGWDCPRAKILIKLRENMNETFEIQTLGRLRRMPEAHHYDEFPLLNFSFLYTFDEAYKEHLLKYDGMPVQKVFIKEKAKEISLIKQLKNKDNSTVDPKLAREKIHHFIKEQYHLTGNQQTNKNIFQNNGFIINNVIKGKFIKGMVIQLNELAKIDNDNLARVKNEDIEYAVNTHIHGALLRMNIDKLKKYTGLTYEKTRVILEEIFRINVGDNKYKLLKLKLPEFYAFIINNINKLLELFKEFSGLLTKQFALEIPKEIIFKIPQSEIYLFNPRNKIYDIYNKNVYKEYNKSMVNSITRSKCEILFEDYCENNDRIKFVYKNGDVGQQYLSIIYKTNLNKEMAFYPDYIIQDIEDNIYIIEAKGGQVYNKDMNIDEQAKNKFQALKKFSERQKYNFAFIRYIDNSLFYSDTEYVDDMYNNIWKSIDILFSKL